MRVEPDRTRRREARSYQKRVPSSAQCEWESASKEQSITIHRDRRFYAGSERLLGKSKVESGVFLVMVTWPYLRANGAGRVQLPRGLSRAPAFSRPFLWKHGRLRRCGLLLGAQEGGGSGGGAAPKGIRSPRHLHHVTMTDMGD